MKINEKASIMKKYLIYTVLIGGDYDNIIQLSVIDDRFDYICFVGKGEKKKEYVGNWRIIEVDSDVKDNVRLSRYPKLVPHKTEVSKYEYSLYIDANINIKGSDIYQRFLELVKHDVSIALLKHPFRDCVYQEGYVCLAALKGGWLPILKQLIFLRYNHVRPHSGLYEANLIFRKHNDPEIIKLGSLWWITFMKYSKRDQLSLVYALQKQGIEPVYYLKPGLSTRNHSSLDKLQHNAKEITRQMRRKQRVVRILQKMFKPILKEDSKNESFYSNGRL